MESAAQVVGYTAGVYDMFHVGHLNLLRRARERFDRLIVAVTTDELSVARKGKLPVICYDERVQIVAAVRGVDEVVPQDDMDKFAAWQRLGFEKIFVGDDWQGTAAWDALEARFAPVGVEVVYLPYTRETSSTALRAALEQLG
jgi:glycerol-3-phosphate cytidylyltransferase